MGLTFFGGSEASARWDSKLRWVSNCSRAIRTGLQQPACLISLEDFRSPGEAAVEA